MSDPDFADLERAHDDLLADEAGEALRPEACDSFVAGGLKNLTGDETCSRCGFSEDDHR